MAILPPGKRCSRRGRTRVGATMTKTGRSATIRIGRAPQRLRSAVAIGHPDPCRHWRLARAYLRWRRLWTDPLRGAELRPCRDPPALSRRPRQEGRHLVASADAWRMVSPAPVAEERHPDRPAHRHPLRQREERLPRATLEAHPDVERQPARRHGPRGPAPRRSRLFPSWPDDIHGDAAPSRRTVAERAGAIGAPAPDRAGGGERARVGIS